MASSRSKQSRRSSAKKRDDALDLFLPWVSRWFRDEVGEPTAPQAQAWPLIARGEHVLVHAPTGSGKTFAAFLWAINGLFSDHPHSGPLPSRERGRKLPSPRSSPGGRGLDAPARGVKVLYISPLKALNNDIERNLRAPLEGIRRYAAKTDVDLPEVAVAVRTGDTPPNERAAMVRRPPHILITTPESLYLVLTSPRARDILRTVRTVIVDEIHTLVPNKRGAHLVLSLERLEQLAPGFQRIGLSATQRPLEEVARFLGGQEVNGRSGDLALAPRPVHIVDAPYAKKLELEVLGMPEQPGAESQGSIWPGVLPKLLEDIRSHRTTLIFCNSRRQAERAADRLNSQWAAEQVRAGGPSTDEGMDQGGTVNGVGVRPTPQPSPSQGEGARTPRWPLFAGFLGSGEADGPFRAHHSSVSEGVRRQLEKDLKAGRLPALVGTSSLELGIDIGSVDLVVQLGSPKSVTQGLQRAGRSGHSVGETSRGRIYALHNEDVLESAAVARGMMAGEVEEIRAPRNALDVLAQQVVAAVSVDGWAVQDLYRAMRGAYSYEDLKFESFLSVLKLVSGKYPRHIFSTLKARINWDEANGKLYPLPSGRMAALNNGGALVDRGAFSVYMGDRKTRLGELDEEFVWETRPGDAFMLGSQVWRATEIEDDRVIVEPAPGAIPRMPFWRGDFPWRPMQFSERLARFRRELAARVSPHVEAEDDPPDVLRWLQHEYRLDRPGASQLVSHVRRQLRAIGAIASDKTVIVETYQDAAGDRRLVIHSPFGGKVNAPWAIALGAALRERTGVQPEAQVGDDGILFRFPEADAPLPVDVVESLDANRVKQLVLNDLTTSPLFGAVFRQNAYRALLLPGQGRGKRTPFWLQRLKAKDLLAVARGLPDFPILLESYRDCLEDALDIPGLEKVVNAIQDGGIQVVKVESRRPSPVAEALSFGFASFYVYEWDAPKAERSMQALRLDRGALAALVRDPSFAGVLAPEAVADVVAAASRASPGRRARSATELAQLIEDLGDLTEDEIADRCEGDAAQWLAELEAEGRAARTEVPLPVGPETRWVSPQAARRYAEALGTRAEAPEALKAVLAAWLARNGPQTLAAIQARYPAQAGALGAALEALGASGEAVWGYFTPGAGEREWADARALAAIQSRTLSLLRAEVTPVSPLVWQAHVSRIQGISPSALVRGIEGIRRTLETVVGVALAPQEWTSEVLPSRVVGFSLADMESLFKSGEFAWTVAPSPGGGQPAVRVTPRGTGNVYLSDAALDGGDRPKPNALSEGARPVFQFLTTEGVASSADLRAALPSLTLTGLRSALRELVMGGYVTGDSWLAMAALTSQAEAATATIPVRLAGPLGHRALRGHTAARRAAAQRLRQVAASMAPEAKWSFASRFQVMGGPVDLNDRSRIRANALLKRYGVVSRRSVEAEGGAWEWGPIERALALMELRGSVRRGYFVHGLPGVQYALPGTVEALRALRTATANEVAVLCATDPALVLGPGTEQGSRTDQALLRFTRLPSTSLVLLGARPVLLAERRGEALRPTADPLLRDHVPAAIEALRDRLVLVGGRITVKTWDGAPVLKSAGAALLAAAGFGRDYPGMSFDVLRARAVSSGAGSAPSLPAHAGTG